MKRSIIEVITKEFPYDHSSQIIGPYIDVAVAKRYKCSPLNVSCENTEEFVSKGVDENWQSYSFDARSNPYVTVRAVQKVNVIEKNCSSYEDFRHVAGKHGGQLGEIWCTAEMFDLSKTMNFVTQTMQLRVMGRCPIYKKFITEVIASERLDDALNDAIIDFYQRKLSETQNQNQNQKITIAMIGEHHWIPDRALDNMFFKIFNDETKLRRFHWLVNTLRWFPIVKPDNKAFISVTYHHPTYLTYTLWRFETGFDPYKFNMACNILDKYLYYDHRLVDKDKEFLSTSPWDWVIRWSYMLPVAIRIKLLDNIERHKYEVKWVCTSSKMFNPHWTVMGEYWMGKMDHNTRSAIVVFMDALGCECIPANLYLIFLDQCKDIISSQV